MTKASNPSPLIAKMPAPSTLAYGSLEEAFPSVPAGLRPFGDKVLVQIRTPMTRTKGGIYVPPDARATEQWNTQVAKVVGLGPVAFHNRDTLQVWPEGLWVKVGMYVRCPKYGGDRWEVPVPNSPDTALFALFRDVELGGEIEGDPLVMVAYLQ